MTKTSESIHTSLESELKKKALLNDVDFSQAMRIGINVILKKREGVAGLMNREKEILNNIERLQQELIIIREEIKKLKQKIEEEKINKEKEIANESLQRKRRLLKTIKLNNL